MVAQPRVVEAAYRLLAEVSPTGLTIRAVADAAGMTATEVLEHFRSPDQVLLAAIHHGRDRLATIAGDCLAGGGPALARLERYAERVLTEVADHPALANLIHAHVGMEAHAQVAIKHLVASQIGFATELLRRGQAEHVVAPDLTPEDCAVLFVGMLHGLMLQRALGAHDASPTNRLSALFAIFSRAVVTRFDPAGAVRGDGPRTTESSRTSQRDGLFSLDVRPMIARGDDPLDAVLAAVESVGPGGVVKLTADFRPKPLVTLLESHGHGIRVVRVNDSRFDVEVVVGGEPKVADLRDLEAPEPLERVLSATSNLPPGGVYLARLPRFPRLLLPHLSERGLTWHLHEEADESVFLRVWQPD